MKSTWLAIFAITASAVCAQQQKIPVQSADKTTVSKPPQPIEPNMKGYGTRGVEGATLDQMLSHCRQVGQPLSQVEKARCEQLLRSLDSQPGNSDASPGPHRLSGSLQ